MATMRESLADGWHLGGAAIDFVRHNSPLKRFVLGAIGAVVPIAAAVAAVAVALRRHLGPVGYTLVGVGASYCFTLMVTAVAVGAAALAAQTLDGRPVSPSTGWEAMRLRRRPIAGWAVVESLVGLPSRAMASWGIDQLGGLLLGFGWSVLSFFAIPTIALTGAGPLGTARHSLRLIRSRWGDAVYSTVYVWLRSAVVFGLPAAGSVAAGVILLRAGAEVLGVALFAAGVAGLALAYLLAQLARTVLTVVLYRYADTGTVYPAFPAELLERSLRGPSRFVRSLAQRIEGDRIRRLRAKLLGNVER